MLKHSLLLSASILLLGLVLAGNAAPQPSLRNMSNRHIARILDRVPIYNGHAVYRRFDSLPLEAWSVDKRNNAEVVNHILKNFGALDRLGDVGK